MLRAVIIIPWIVAGYGTDQASPLADRALARTFELYALEAPHIAETRAERMTELEARMTLAETDARSALAQLVGAQAGRDAFEQLMRVHREILRLAPQQRCPVARACARREAGAGASLRNAAARAEPAARPLSCPRDTLRAP